jgi:hypothetical protein
MQPGKADDALRAALATALVDVGCPTALAREMADRARVEWDGPRFGNPGARLLMLETPAADRGIEYPAEPEDVEATVRQLAANVAADNAEAGDRTARGEPGWTALWPLPDRGQRR